MDSVRIFKQNRHKSYPHHLGPRNNHVFLMYSFVKCNRESSVILAYEQASRSAQLADVGVFLLKVTHFLHSLYRF